MIGKEGKEATAPPRSLVSRLFGIILTVILLIWTMTFHPPHMEQSRVERLGTFTTSPAIPFVPHPVNATPKPKATFVILCRNSDLHDWKLTMLNIENVFNKHHHYPYVFLNDQPFTTEFMQHVSAMTNATVHFGLIPVSHWRFPKWISPMRASYTRNAMRDVIYGASESYRHMCRFESGFFYRHELLDAYDYYWRLEPGVTYHCHIDRDPFRFMAAENKMFGFTISLGELMATIPTLWDTVKGFMKEHPELIAERNALKWISDDGGETYNGCHIWTNFEIANLNFYRSKAYETYFEYLDRAGGFFYERWGDAPVHSIAMALMLPPEQIHFFGDIGYYHPGLRTCPLKEEWYKRCDCDNADSFERNTGWSCTHKWKAMFQKYS